MPSCSYTNSPAKNFVLFSVSLARGSGFWMNARLCAFSFVYQSAGNNVLRYSSSIPGIGSSLSMLASCWRILASFSMSGSK